MEDVKNKTHEIGIQLGIGHSKMITFMKEDNPLLTTLDHWLRGNVSDNQPSWASIITVLKSKQVGEIGLANKLSAKYCQKNDDEGYF